MLSYVFLSLDSSNTVLYKANAFNVTWKYNSRPSPPAWVHSQHESSHYSNKCMLEFVLRRLFFAGELFLLRLSRYFVLTISSKRFITQQIPIPKVGTWKYIRCIRYFVLTDFVLSGIHCRKKYVLLNDTKVIPIKHYCQVHEFRFCSISG